jgi:hypothetical protein
MWFNSPSLQQFTVQQLTLTASNPLSALCNSPRQSKPTDKSYVIRHAPTNQPVSVHATQVSHLQQHDGPPMPLCLVRCTSLVAARCPLWTPRPCKRRANNNAVTREANSHADNTSPVSCSSMRFVCSPWLVCQAVAEAPGCTVQEGGSLANARSAEMVMRS